VEALAELEEEMALRTDSREELRELFAAAEVWHGNADGPGSETTRQALVDLRQDAHARRTSGPAPRSLGPLAAVALRHPSGTHEAVLLGTLHTAYFPDPEDNPVPGAIRRAIRDLEPSLVVAELDEDRAAEPSLVPQHVRGRMSVIHRQPPGEGAANGGGVSMEDPVLEDVIEALGEEAPGLPKLRRMALKIWTESSDSRLFENSFYLTALEANLRGDFGRDIRATLEATAAVGAPLVLGDLPLSNLMSEAALERTRSAFAERRSGMLSLVRSKEAFLRFEAARRRLTWSTMRKRGGADLDLLGRCCWLMEPLGAAYNSMLLALTEIRDPFLASALSEPEAIKAFEKRPGGSGHPPLAVAVLGTAHLPGVAAVLEAQGWKRLEAPSRGWPRGRPASRKPQGKARANRPTATRGARKGRAARFR